ncbi:MAG: cell division protein FtsL [Janthinobacterium lividum]
MTRLNVLLLLAVLASALFLVHTQYRSRLLFTELDRVNTEAHRLEVDGDRLQVEKRAQSTPLRVEKLAKEQLRMRTTTPAITQYVRQDGTVIPPIAAPAPVASAAAATSARKVR